MRIGGIMGSIFGFGTKRAAQISGLGSLATLLSAGALPPQATVDVAISGLRSAKGNVLICLTANPKHFPDCGKDPKSLKQSVAAAKAGLVKFAGIAPGTYAVAIVHDENGNNKMDLAIFVPKEGFAFSRNPAISFGPPKFASAQFKVADTDVTQNVKMKYML